MDYQSKCQAQSGALAYECTESTKRLKTLSIRQVSNGYLTEEINYGIMSNNDAQKGTVIHKTAEEVAEYVKNYLNS